MLKLNLNSPEYNRKFSTAKIYIKAAVVSAVQITAAGLESGAYQDKDVRFDEATQAYVIDTYVMTEESNPNCTGCVRGVRLEDTRPVQVGEWIVTNPKSWDTDRDNNYAMPDATFRKRYEPTETAGKYRARGMARIIENDTGDEVEIDAPWGGTQSGDAGCYFCAPYDKENPDDLAQGQRYILSANDFSTYELFAAE